MSRIGWALILVVSVISPTFAAPGATELYWAGSSSGFHRIVPGTGSSTFLAHNPVPTYGAMALHNGQLYWITFGDQKLWRSELDGSQAQEIPMNSIGSDVLLAVRGGVRLNDDDVILSLDQDLSSGQNYSPVAAVAADYANGKLYWVGGWNSGGAGILGRANLDLSGPEILLSGLDLQDYTLDLVVDSAGGKVYWTNPNLQKIQRANLDGSGLEDVATGVDATALAINVPEPSAALAAVVAFLGLRRPKKHPRE